MTTETIDYDKAPVELDDEATRVAERDAATATGGFRDEVIESWKRYDHWRADVSCRGGTGLMPFWPTDKPDGKRGDTLRIYSRGLGFEYTGVSLIRDGVVLHISYQTKREKEVEHGAWVANWNREQRETFDKHKGELDAAYESLPPALKRRIDRFRAEDPKFRWSGEAYEMAACAEAGRLFRRAMDPAFGEAIKAHGIKIVKPELWEQKVRAYDARPDQLTADWENTPLNRLVAFDSINEKPNGYNYKLMKELMPEMDDGHSGNTWGHAVMFARVLLRDGDAAKL